MKRQAIVTLVFVLLSVMGAMAQSAVPPRITQAVDERNLVRLAGTVHPLAQAQYDRGAAPDDMPLARIHLVLKRSPAQETALRQLISDMHRPGSASYHKWLTPDQFGQQFGPSDQDIATVTSWLGSHGFQVTKVQPGKQVLEFSGNVAQMRDAFHTQIHKYVVNGETHHANASDPQIPAALAPVVGGFVSLNNFPLKRHSHVLGQATYNTQTHTAQPEWTYGTVQGGVNFPLAPADFAIQYDLNPLYSAQPAINGANQAIAVVDDSNINIALVNQFRSLFGLSANPPQVIIDGNDPGIDGINNPDGPNFGSLETYLDVEWAGAVAPAATIDLVIGADTLVAPGVILAAVHAVVGNTAPVLSLSRGFCEAGLDGENGFLNALWEQAAAQGITVVVSSGDNGSAGCDDFNTQQFAVNGLAVSGFASTPFNVAVGGTDFFYSDFNNPAALDAQLQTYWNFTPSQLPQASLLQVVPEQPWNDSQYGLDIFSFFNIIGATTIAAGSGGASACATGTPAIPLQIGGTCAGYPKPAWQTGAGVPADGVRDLPDVSLFAADGVNLSFYPICAFDGDCQLPAGNNLVQITGVGGTSASVQVFAGIMALVNQKWGRQGQANFVLYPLKTQFPAAFHDVTNGTNSVPCAFSPGPSPNCIAVNSAITVGGTTEGQIGSNTTAEYNAAAGYNLATGLGTINGNLLVTDWGLVKFTGTTVNLTSPTAGMNVSHGTSVTFTGTVTETGADPPSGDVAIMTDSTEPANQGETFLTLNNGAFNGSINFLPGGTYNLWANYGGDATHASSVSPKVQITVTPEASTNLFNIFNVAGNVAIAPRGAVPYGTQLILDAEPVPTTFFNQCINTQNPPASCNTPSFTSPTGTVTFADSGSNINTAVLNLAGDAEFNAPFGVGAHSVSAAYSGDASYNASNASAIPFTIAKATPALLVSTNSSQGGQPTVLTVRVENISNSAAESTFQIGFSNPVTAPTGTVTLSGVTGGTLTSTALSPAIDPQDLFAEGVATITVPSSVPPQTYNNVTFNYAGDANYSTTALITSVTVASPTLLASTTAATTTGSISPTTSLTVNGTVTGQSTHPAPTGSVLFVYPGNPQFILAQAAISPVANDVSSFSATFNSQTLFQGANAMTVQYSGDSNYGPSATTLSINNPLSDFAMVPVATIVPVLAGGSAATDTVNVSSMNGFSGMVTFNCTAPTGITCPSPSNINLASGGSAAITLHISASAPSFTVAGQAPPAPVAAGSSGVATVTVTPSAGSAFGNNNILLTATAGSFVHTLGIDAFVSSPVQVSCPAGATLPPGVTCPNPLNINLTSSAAVTGQLTVNVAAPSAPGTTAEVLPANRTEYASLQGGPRNRSGWWKLSAGTGLAAIFLIFVPGRRRYRTAMGLWLVCLLSFAMGCGGMSSVGTGPTAAATTTKITAPQPQTKVPPGTALGFPVNVTLTSSGMPAGNGMVQLFDGATALGAPMPAVNGAVTIVNNTLSVGTHAISAHYLGDASTGASQSGTVFVTVTGQTTVGIAANPPAANGNTVFNLTID